jgi:hypothetical protein
MVHMDYLVSNETDYQHVVPFLRQYSKPGNVYIGVGPDQNFTYITAVHPAFSFIVDYRTENQLLHYLFKACFELSTTRQEYLSILFSKPLDDHLKKDSCFLSYLLEYFSKASSDEVFFKQNSFLTQERIKNYRKLISNKILEIIQKIHRCFFRYNLNLRTRNGITSWLGYPYPTYYDFLSARDRNGACWSFLDDDDRFLWLKRMQYRNKIISLAGDLSGSRTLNTLASFIREKSKKVSVLYVSNSEELLFRYNLFKAYVENIQQLPIDEDSIIIRSVVNRTDRKHPAGQEGHMLTTVAQRMIFFLNLFSEGRYRSYWDVATLDYLC